MFKNQRGMTLTELLIVIAILAAILAVLIIPFSESVKTSRRGSTETFVETVHRDHQNIVQAPSQSEPLRGRFRVTGFDLSIPGVVKVFFERIPEVGEEAMPFSGITADQTIRVGDEVNVALITFAHDLGGNWAKFNLVTKK